MRLLDLRSSVMTAPGWYRDPAGAPVNRWWDGVEWTQYTQDPVQLALLAHHRRAARDRQRAWFWVTLIAALVVFGFLIVGLNSAVNH
jgi:hypothetical protein